jgi:hypothetical protein
MDCEIGVYLPDPTKIRRGQEQEQQKDNDQVIKQS